MATYFFIELWHSTLLPLLSVFLPSGLVPANTLLPFVLPPAMPLLERAHQQLHDIGAAYSAVPYDLIVAGKALATSAIVRGVPVVRRHWLLSFWASFLLAYGDYSLPSLVLQTDFVWLKKDIILVTFAICWWLITYCPGDIGYKAFSFKPIKVACKAASGLARTNVILSMAVGGALSTELCSSPSLPLPAATLSCSTPHGTLTPHSLCLSSTPSRSTGWPCAPEMLPMAPSPLSWWPTARGRPSQTRIWTPRLRSSPSSTPCCASHPLLQSSTPPTTPLPLTPSPVKVTRARQHPTAPTSNHLAPRLCHHPNPSAKTQALPMEAPTGRARRAAASRRLSGALGARRRRSYLPSAHASLPPGVQQGHRHGKARRG
ncbi:hypothetical protein CLOP_g2726 [Closterium sp. NIES-67]|nr:hypothetical protein CLOP_g2726 [Closterium sp. NIES-67]